MKVYEKDLAITICSSLCQSFNENRKKNMKKELCKSEDGLFLILVTVHQL